MRFLYMLMIISVFIIPGCVAKDNSVPEGQSKENVSGKPEEVMEKFAEALAKNDVDNALNLYSADVFQMEGVTESAARQILADQLRNQEVPVFASGTMKIEKVTNYSQIDYEIAGKKRHLLFKETPQGWRITNSMLSE